MFRPQINTPSGGKNGYIALFSGKRAEVWADSLYQAKQLAVVYFKAPKSKQHQVYVELCEVEGHPVSSPSQFS